MIWFSTGEKAAWMVACTHTNPADVAKPPPNGFTLFLIDVKEARAAGTLSYTPIPKMGSNILKSSQVFFDDVRVPARNVIGEVDAGFGVLWDRSEEHTSELQSLMRISYAVFCLKKKKTKTTRQNSRVSLSQNDHEIT